MKARLSQKQRNSFVKLLPEFYNRVVVAGGETNKRQKAKICLNILKSLSSASVVKQKIVRTVEASRESICN